jgi:hypothetical protein
VINSNYCLQERRVAFFSFLEEKSPSEVLFGGKVDVNGALGHLKGCKSYQSIKEGWGEATRNDRKSSGALGP